FHKQGTLFHSYERGHISTEEFLDALLKWCPPHTTHEDLIFAWNSILIGMPEQRFTILEKFRSRYNIFILSNINDLHIDGYLGIMRRDFPNKDFEAHFNAVHYSCKI